MLSRSFFGNIQDRRVEAEVCDSVGTLIAIIYEDDSGWHIEQFASGPAQMDESFVAQVKKDLARYTNRKGDNPPEGLTAAGLALWLMQKDDGTAMGLPT